MWFQQLLRSNRKGRNSLYGSTLMSHWAFRLLPWIDINNIASFPVELFQHVTMLQTLSIMSCLGLATLVHWTGSLNLHTQHKIHLCCLLTSLPQDEFTQHSTDSYSLGQFWFGNIIGLDRQPIFTYKHLQIYSCPKLASLLKYMCVLSTLWALTIGDCYGLETFNRLDR